MLNTHKLIIIKILTNKHQTSVRDITQLLSLNFLLQNVVVAKLLMPLQVGEPSRLVSPVDELSQHSLDVNPLETNLLL